MTTPARIECRTPKCHHALRRQPDGTYRHSGPKAATCQCPCEGQPIENIPSWWDIDEKIAQKKRGSSTAGAEASAVPPAPAVVTGVVEPAPLPGPQAQAPPPLSLPPSPPAQVPLPVPPQPAAPPAPGPVDPSPVVTPATPGSSPLTDGQAPPPEPEPADLWKKISNSEVQTWKRCQRKWWLAYYRALIPGSQEVVGPRELGTRVHLALAAYYSTRRVDPMTVFTDAIKEDLEAFPEKAEDIEAQADLGMAMLEGYFQWVAETGADEGLTIIGDEVKMLVPSSIPGVYLLGKLDVRLERQMDTARLFMDHKTVGNLTTPVRTLHMDEQMKMYMLLERLDAKYNAPNGSEGEFVAGGLYNMLRKVKRTVRANPPFYDRVEVHHSDVELRNFYQALHGAIQQILSAQRALDSGVDHHYVVPPKPDSSCTWQCDFFNICPMLDDGSHAEGFIEAYYRTGDPYEHYEVRTNDE